MAAFLGAIIGPVSAWLLLLNSTRIYYEYYLYPRMKGPDLYIYPQWRYTIFDLVLVAWCADGIVASVLLFRSVILGRNIEGWAGRSTVLFFLGLGLLVGGAVFGTWLRSMGV
jgi:hypothetical protein